jgi:ABC-2 type transport system ATP-binding protein
VAAVDGVGLLVPTGSVFGFLGPNGSGKTTTIRMLLGLISPTAGTWSLLGETMPGAAPSALARIGALIEGPAFYPWLSGRDNLARIDAAGPDGRRSSRRPRIEAALARVGLSAAATKKYKAYSLGMRQRLGLASALLRPRDLLVLDEPTNGMDPQGTREIRHLIRDLASDGTTVFLSSHLLSEIEQVCTHAAVMSHGLLLAQGPLAELRAAGEARLRVEVDDVPRAAELLSALGLEEIQTEGDAVTARLSGSGDGAVGPERCCRELVMAGIGVRALATLRPSLEDLFVSLTGEGFDVAG